MACNIRYATLDPGTIYDLTDPMHLVEFRRLLKSPGLWWSPQFTTYREFVGQRYEELFNDNIGHYSLLEESILQRGIINPIVVTSGSPRFQDISNLPPHIQPNADDMIFSEVWGGSRLKIAKKHNIKVKCIINDWNGIFRHKQLLQTDYDILQLMDKPDEYKVKRTTSGVTIANFSFSHIPDKTYTMESQVRLRRSIIDQITQELWEQLSRDYPLMVA